MDECAVRGEPSGVDANPVTEAAGKSLHDTGLTKETGADLCSYNRDGTTPPLAFIVAFAALARRPRRGRAKLRQGNCETVSVGRHGAILRIK